MRTVVATLFFLAFAVLSVDVKAHVKRAEDASPLDSLPIGRAMPDFTLFDTAGKPYSLRALARQNAITVVDFWGTWCAPCRMEMPSFEKMYAEQSKRGLLILAVDEQDELPALSAYLKTKPVSFPVLRDPTGALVKRFGVRAFPTTVLVGSDGNIIQVMQGVEPYLAVEVAEQIKAHDAMARVPDAPSKGNDKKK